MLLIYVYVLNILKVSNNFSKSLTLTLCNTTILVGAKCSKAAYVEKKLIDASMSFGMFLKINYCRRELSIVNKHFSKAFSLKVTAILGKGVLYVIRSCTLCYYTVG